MPILHQFLEGYPTIALEISADEAFVDIVADGFDAGVRLGQSVERDMVAMRITPDIRTAIIGATRYFERHAVPEHPRELIHHRCIGWRQVSRGAIFRWPFAKDGNAQEVAVTGPVTFDDPFLMIDAALDGVGLAWADEPVVAEHIAAGRLVRVLTDWRPVRPGFFLYYPNRKGVSAALRALMEALVAAEHKMVPS